MAGPGSNYAFCLYRASDGIPETGSSVAVNVVPQVLQGDDSPAARVDLTLHQPPVVLLHGLWSSGAMWKDFDLNDYGNFELVVTPSYPNSRGLADNSWKVNSTIDGACDVMRRQGIAVARADVIGHSMGGLVSRY